MAPTVSSHPYKIYVSTQNNNHGIKDDPSLESPKFTFKCIVNMNYKPCNKPDESIRAYIPGLDYRVQFEHSADELTGHLLSSTVFSSTTIPFELKNLHWNQQVQDKESIPVMSVEGIVNSMLQVCHNMISEEEARNSRRKKHCLLVFIKKEVIMSGEEYLAMLRKKEQEEVLEQLQAMVRLQAEGWNFGPKDREIMTEAIRRVGLGNSIEEALDLARRRAMRESGRRAVVRPVPAAAEAVEALEKVTVLSITNNGSTKTEENCTVCMEEMKVGSQVTQMPCSHVFHSPCIEKWLKQISHKCPICRFKLRTTVNV